ncbi:MULTISPECIES: pentapeptide repeat-containing protein [unclassified Caballeronia]|uniref:pentapeptide repeat-containing protein n=1 Tax=unclassified Caballeronia TaxID=2646786 RepID=UPI00202821F3|nr:MULTISPECIES: pentapeptide repeat-containing protein [unclassified Caballeronia]
MEIPSSTPESGSSDLKHLPSHVPQLPAPKDVLQKGNREVITDHYFAANVEKEAKRFRYKVFVRLNAKEIAFKRVSFEHCVFDGCYLNTCVFDTCDFTGCRFIGSNFHQTAFIGCKFDYATFERCHIDHDILRSEAPRAENLRMRFARSLRMNYQQVGDAKAVNQAISLELQATSTYLLKSWSSKESYYQKKFGGWKRFPQLVKWADFWILDFIWGNGESVWNLLRTIMLVLVLVAVYDTARNGSLLHVDDILTALCNAPGEFLGIIPPRNFSPLFLDCIVASRFVTIALLTAMLVKRFGRR